MSGSGNYLHRRAGGSRDVHHFHHLCLHGSQNFYRLADFPLDGLNLQNNFLVAQGEENEDDEQEIEQADKKDKAPAGVQVEAVSQVTP
jgi:hypothetical protein